MTTSESLASLSHADLFKHFKASAPLEDLRFFLASTREARRAIGGPGTALLGLFTPAGKLTIKRADFYKQLASAQDAWRQDAAKRWAVERACTRLASLWADARHMDSLTQPDAPEALVEAA
jgi:hypothetical protein